MRPLWIQAALALTAVWLVVGGVSWWAKNAKPTPESIAKYLETHSPEGRSPEDRREMIESVANQLNRLAYEERRETRMQRRPDKFFKHLTPDEQAYFLDLTLPQGFKQMMEAFNKMTPEKRKQFVEKSIADLRRDREAGSEKAPPNMEDPNVQKMVDTGMKSFYSEASADTKMDLAPLIDEMQQNMQGR